MTIPFVEMLMQQAQKMQEAVKGVQQELQTLEVTGTAGAGMVKVTLNGQYHAQSIVIEDSVLQGSKSVVQDLILAAINDAVSQVAEEAKAKMSRASSGLGFPAHFLKSLNLSS